MLLSALTVPGQGFTYSQKENIDTKSKICSACGTQFPPGSQNMNSCPICEDSRQFVPESGQTWTTEEELINNNSVRVRKVNDKLYELTIIPSFAIGQRAFLILSGNGNILWDCIPLLNETTIDFIKAKGGIKAIAFSHPHYYSNMNDWAETFNCPVFIHEADEQWVFNKSNRIRFWPGKEKELWDGIKIVNIGGHFPGSSILHIPFLSAQGTILCGDTLYISRSKKHIAVMHSYPNQIPLPLDEVRRIKERLETINFDTMHGAFEFQNLGKNVKSILTNSMQKYSLQ